MSTSMGITELLISWSQGDQTALDSLMPLVEQELHKLAHRYMRHEDVGHLLQTTALINETFLKLVDQNRVQWQNRAHFFGIAAQIMRRVLLNYARDQHRLKRGGQAIHLSLSHAETLTAVRPTELIALDDALEELAKVDPRKSKVVELRYFGGLSVEETAEVLNVAPITVARDWNLARAWLAREIKHGS